MSIEQIQASIQSGQFTVALEQANTLLEHRPTDVKLWYAKALALISLNQPDAAISAASYATCLEPSLAIAHRLQGKAQQSLGNIEDAIASYKKAMQAYIKEGDKGSAHHCLALIEALRSPTVDHQPQPLPPPILSSDPLLSQASTSQNTGTIQLLVDPKTILDTIKSLIQEKRYGEALQDLNWFLQVDPNHIEALTQRALIYANQHHKQPALKDLARAKKLNPTQPTIRLTHCQIQLLLDDAQGAIANLSAILDPQASAAQYFLTPQYLLKVYILRGNAYAQLTNLEEAKEDYDTALRIDPTCADAYCGRGQIYDHMGQINPATLDYQHAAQLYLEQGQHAAYQQMQQWLFNVESKQHAEKLERARTIRVPITCRRSGIPVLDVTFNQSFGFPLMLDTGAAITSITSSMAKQLRIVPTGQKRFQVADGRVVTNAVGQVDSIAVGDAKVQNLEVAIMSEQMRHGLLGENFLTHYNVKILDEDVEFQVRWVDQQLRL